MRITVDLMTCKAYANCMAEAPDVFEYNDETGKVRLLMAEVGPERRDEVERAVDACPVQAISLSD